MNSEKLLMIAINEILGLQKYLIEKVNEIDETMKDLQNQLAQDK